MIYVHLNHLKQIYVLVKDAIYLTNAIQKEKDVFIKALLMSSFIRKESIGYFIRTDFPVKKRLSKNHHIYLKLGSIHIDQNESRNT